MRNRTRYLAILLAAVMVLGLLSGMASATALHTVWVCADEGDDTTGTGTAELPFLTIQKGVDEVAEGGTVYVRAGLYQESITVDKDGLNIVAVGVATVDSLSNCFTIAVDSVRIEGFRLETEAHGIRFTGQVSGGTISIVDNDIAAVYAGISFGDWLIAGTTATITGNVIQAGYEGIIVDGRVQQSTVTIVENTIDSKDEGIYLDGQVDESYVSITGNEVESETWDAIRIYGDVDDSSIIIADNPALTSVNASSVVFYPGTASITGSNVSIVGNSITADHSAIIIAQYVTESVVTIRNNQATAARGIRLMEDVDDSEVWIQSNTLNITSNRIGIGLCAYVYDSTVDISNNDLVGDVDTMGCTGIMIDELYGSEVTIARNSILDFQDGIYMDELGRAELEVLVDIADNHISLSAGNDGHDGIYLCCPERTTSVTGNVITGAFQQGIYMNDVGCCGASPLVLHVRNNEIDGAEYGIYIDELFCCVTGSAYIMDNTMRNNNYGLYFYDIDDRTDEPVSLLISGNLFENCVIGTWVEDIYAEEEDSRVIFTNNNFVNTDQALVFDCCMDLGSGLTVAFNSFAGSDDFGLRNDTGDDVVARLNWWGRASGPGSAVIGDVAVNPWLATVGMPGNSEQTVDNSVTITATLKDDAGATARTNDLWVRFTVTGANSHTGIVPMNNGTASFTYTSSRTGTDTVTADVLFAGETAGLMGQTRIDWKSATPSLGDLFSGIVVVARQPIPIVLTVGSATAMVGNNQATLDSAPYIQPESGRTMVPIRLVSEQLGAKVFWLAETKQVRIMHGDIDVRLTIGSSTAVVNGEKVEMDCAPEIVNGRTFVPLRFVSEALGADVVWDAATRSITIKK